MLVALVKCIIPNTKPDTIINTMLLLNMVLKFNLNIISSVIGAMILADIIAYIELTQNKSKKVINIEMEHHREGQMSIHRIF